VSSVSLFYLLALESTYCEATALLPKLAVSYLYLPSFSTLCEYSLTSSITSLRTASSAERIPRTLTKRLGYLIA
jgi:hypothetical protein